MVQYNLPSEKGRDTFQWYEGKNTEQMPLLIAEGRVPMNIPQLMQRRLQLRNDPTEVKTAWGDNYLVSGDTVVCHPNGDVKIILDSQILRAMIPTSPRNMGSLVIGEEVYEALQGDKVHLFKKRNLGKINDSMSREGVKAHPVWKVLARDQALLNDYTDLIFAEGKERFGYDTAMGVYPGSCSGDKPQMRAWYLWGLEGRSKANSRTVLDFDLGRLVGIVPETQDIPDKINYWKFTI